MHFASLSRLLTIDTTWWRQQAAPTQKQSMHYAGLPEYAAKYFSDKKTKAYTQQVPFCQRAKDLACESTERSPAHRLRRARHRQTLAKPVPRTSARSRVRSTRKQKEKRHAEDQTQEVAIDATSDCCSSSHTHDGDAASMIRHSPALQKRKTWESSGETESFTKSVSRMP